VERYPVGVTPPKFRAAGHQLMDIRVDDLQRQERRQLRRTSRCVAVDMDFPATLAVPHAQRRLPRARIYAAKQHKLFVTIAHQVLRACAPKRTSAAQISDGFQNAGLAAGVGAANQVVGWLRPEFDRLKTAKIRAFDDLERHQA
jgi:hypothetical protein